MERIVTTHSLQASGLHSSWNEACLRLEDYLRSFQIEDQEHVLRLTLHLLAKARMAQRKNPSESPVRVTLRLADEEARTWFTRLAVDNEDSFLKQSAQGCVAYFISGANRKWGTIFMTEMMDPEMMEATRHLSLQTGPAIDFTSLRRQEIDYGPMQTLSRESWLKFSWRQVLQAFFLWMGIFFATYFFCLHYLYEFSTP